MSFWNQSDMYMIVRDPVVILCKLNVVMMCKLNEFTLVHLQAMILYVHIARTAVHSSHNPAEEFLSTSIVCCQFLL